MRKRISATLPDLTIKQLEDLRKFYKREDVLGDEFSMSRLIVICINYFWKHIFEEPNPFNKKTEKKEKSNDDGFWLDE